MGITVRIQGSLSHLTGGKKEIVCEAKDVAECLNQLETQFSGLKGKICNEQGKMLEALNVYVNGDNIRYLQGINTPLKPGDEIAIIQAIAGG
ncbi:MAG TPA: molybdopterin synthase sulfur carrier subunit [Desulfotomaculum sp.]|jgi:molybdopterin synthase sulfur carrier subunit|nr:molybdopterin synthase sulfur carrier subunit [Desulfotomaculum sp.]